MEAAMADDMRRSEHLRALEGEMGARCERRREQQRQKVELIDWLRRAAAERDERPGRMSWYVVRTKRENGESVAAEMDRAGIHVWCPKKKVVKRLPRRQEKVEVEAPLFERYFFVRTTMFEAAWLGVMTFDGVDCLLGQGERPAPVPDRIVAKIQAVEETGVVDRSMLFRRGDAATIIGGPFAGFEARLAGDEGDNRAVDVEVSLFGRLVPVRIGIDDLKKLA